MPIPHSPTAQLAEFGRTVTWEEIPQSAQRAALRAILDNVGCLLGGAETDIARAARAALLDQGSTPQATIGAAGLKASMTLAAFLNGIQANALDYDDAFESDGKGMGHPGSTIVPAGLAVAEYHHAHGRDLAAAITAGFEVANRVIQAIQPTPERHAQVWGVAIHQAFGAVAAAGRLLGLDATAFANAFGLAGTFSTVPAARKWNWTARPLASTKDMTAAPAETGVRVALLAAKGWQGSRDILDGTNGFWVMAGSDRCRHEILTDRLGERWTVEELSFKPYPACRWVHAALEAAETILREANLPPTDIAQVEVGTFADVVEHFDDRRPKTMVDGEFSLPWTLAVCLAGVPKGPLWYAPETFASRDIHAMADRIHLYVDAEAQARHFSDERKSMSVVRITAADGRSFEKRIAVARGGVGSPWRPGELEAKFQSLAAPVIGDAAAVELRDLLLSLPEHAELGRIFELLRGPTKGNNA